MRVIGEAQQSWAPLRRKYNLFLSRPLDDERSNPDAPRLTSGNLPLSNYKSFTVVENDKSARDIGFKQFAYVDEPFLSWDFTLKSSDEQLIGSVNRNFAGFAREIFTDTGVYALRMDAAGQETSLSEEQQQQPSLGMTLDQRAVMLATAVSIDFDYFSRHSGSVGGFGGGFPMPIWLPIPFGGGGGAAAGTEAVGVGAGAAGTAVEGSEAGSAVRGAADAAKGPLGAGEGAIAGAGSLAGYDALQRAREGQTAEQRDDFVPDEQPPPQQQDTYDPWGQSPPPQDQGDPWANQNQDPWGGGGNSGGGGGGGGGGGDSDWGDFF